MSRFGQPSTSISVVIQLMFGVSSVMGVVFLVKVPPFQFVLCCVTPFFISLYYGYDEREGARHSLGAFPSLTHYIFGDASIGEHLTFGH